MNLHKSAFVLALLGGSAIVNASSSFTSSTTSSASSSSTLESSTCAGDAFTCCSLNGDYDVPSQSCTCYPPWGGDNCTILQVLDVPFPSGYGLAPNRSGTWGGNIIAWPAAAEAADGGEAQAAMEYHLFAAEMVNNCTLSSWGTNSQCVHAVSTTPEGPFTKVDIAVDVWCHNPQAIIYVNETGQKNIALFHIGDGTGTPKNCSSSEAEEEMFALASSSLPSSSLPTGLLHSSPSPYGPWAPVNPSPPSCNNPAPMVHPNGTFYLVCASSVFLMYSSPTVAGPWKEVVAIPTKIPYGGVAEDPFLYLGRNNTWHLLSHVYEEVVAPTCDNTTVSAHLYSLDGLEWKVAPVQPYGSRVVFDGWRGEITVPTRERPKFLFAADGVTPTHLLNGVPGGDPTCPPWWCSHCKVLEWTFTLIQPLDLSGSKSNSKRTIAPPPPPPPASTVVTSSSAPPYYPVVSEVALDCSVRTAAWDYSRSLQPERGQHMDVFEALELDTYCNVTAPNSKDITPPPRYSALPSFATSAAAASIYYADALHGDDENSGTEQAPFQSLFRGVQACRQSSAGSGCTLVLFDSAPFVLNSTLELTQSDSGLIITAYPNQAPEVTGAWPLPSSALTWTPYDIENGANVWVAKGAASSLPSTPTTLFVNGTRAIRARWPNGNAEIDRIPTGYSNATTWLPPTPPQTPPKAVPGNFSRPYDVYFPDWTWGTGGTAVGQFNPPEGYWISPSPTAGVTYVVPSGYTYNPTHMSPRASSWGNASGAIVNVFQGLYWANWVFEVANHDSASNTITFGKGGWQDARGATIGGALYVENLLAELDAPNEWFIDSSSGDLYFYYDAPSGTPPPTSSSSFSFAAAQVETLISITGDGLNNSPASNISFVGITFTGSTATYLTRPFRAPSGGDWSFGETAAILLKGTTSFTAHGCTFLRLGGNGLLISGWNRNVNISQSLFTSLGDSAIVSAGYADGQDLSALNVPIGNNIERCVFSFLGMYVKQAGAYYQAITANTTLSNNVAFELPRAAVNINDDAFGGHVVENLLAFSTVSETQDHGPLNSWGRDPFILPGSNINDAGGVGSSSASASAPILVPLTTHIRGCFLVNNKWSIHPLDHDDGSNAMVDTGNVIAFAGMKNWQGFNKHTVSNLFIRPDYLGGNVPPSFPKTTPEGVPLPTTFYFPACARSLGQAAWGQDLADTFINNTCILNATSSPYIFGTCTPTAPSLKGDVPLTGNNTFLTPNATLAIKCGSQTLSLEQAQAVGYEVGSAVMNSGDMTPGDIYGLIHAWLGF